VTRHHRRAKATRSKDCRARLTQLFAYLDGELSPARSQALERHLADCACCEEVAGGLREAIDLCRSAGRQGLPRAVQRQARMRVKQLLDEKT
jgi:anti-sigma factor RsiW